MASVQLISLGLLVISEILPLLPGKVNGIAQGIIMILKALSSGSTVPSGFPVVPAAAASTAQSAISTEVGTAASASVPEEEEQLLNVATSEIEGVIPKVVPFSLTPVTTTQLVDTPASATTTTA